MSETDKTYTSLRTELRDAVLHVVLSRPEVHDAFDDDSVRDLAAAFGVAAAEPGVRVVLLRSTGKHFSAGADVNYRAPDGRTALDLARISGNHDLQLLLIQAGAQ